MSTHPTTERLAQALKIRQKIDKLDNERNKLSDQLMRVLAGTKVVNRADQGQRRKQGPRGASSKATATTRIGRSKESIKEMVKDILENSGKALSIPEILERLKSRGHRTRSANPAKSLGVMLYRDKDFKKAGRGLFSVRGSRTGTSAAVRQTGAKSISSGSGKHQTLKDAVISAFKAPGNVMKVSEIETAVRSAGYKSKAKSLTQQLSKLLKDKRTFRKVKRGVYALRK